MCKKESYLNECEKRFPTEKDCRDYLCSLIWGNQFICPNCGFTEMWEVKPYKYKCRKCSKQISLTAQIEFFKGAHISMQKWFRAIYYICDCNGKVSAAKLQRDLCIGSNRTAQKICNKTKPMLYIIPKNEKLVGKVDLGIERILFSGKELEIVIAGKVHKRHIEKAVILPSHMQETIIDEYISLASSTISKNNYTEKVAKEFEKWCNRTENTGKDIEELMRFYSCYTFLYKVQNIDFDTVIQNIINIGTKNDLSYYYDKHIK